MAGGVGAQEGQGDTETNPRDILTSEGPGKKNMCPERYTQWQGFERGQKG